MTHPVDFPQEFPPSELESDLKTAALLCPASEFWSSDVLRVVNYLAQRRAETLHLQAYAAALAPSSPASL
jgi:hypothetical protein